MGQEIIEQYREQHDKYQGFCNTVCTLLRGLLQSQGLKYHSVDGRVKTEKSLADKMARKQDKYCDLCDITDIAGVRIITYYSDEVDAIAELVEREFDVDQENTIDKRKALDPDRFGYLSLHYVVSLKSNRADLPEHVAYAGMKLEIQIRSILQHTWAEIEHDLGYKKVIEVPREIRRNFSRLAGLLEIADKEFVETRTKLRDYAAQVSEQIGKDDSEVLIDRVSIQAYIDSSAVLKNVNRKLADISHSAYKEETIQDVSFTLKKLEIMGISRIWELDELLKANMSTILAIGKNLLNKNYGGLAFIDNTIGLFYLCYALAAQSKDQLLDYLRQANIHQKETEDETTEQFAQRILDAAASVRTK